MVNFRRNICQGCVLIGNERSGVAVACIDDRPTTWNIDCRVRLGRDSKNTRHQNDEMIAARRRINNRRENNMRLVRGTIVGARQREIDAMDPPQTGLLGRSLASASSTFSRSIRLSVSQTCIDPFQIGRVLWTFLIMIGTITSNIRLLCVLIAHSFTYQLYRLLKYCINISTLH